MVSLGIYILKDSFCISEVSLLKQKLKLLSIKEFFWEDSSEEKKLKMLSEQIAQREQKYKGQNIRFCYCLPQSLVASFSLQLPFKERFKILKTIPFEVEEHTPFQSNKILFDARVCQIREKNQSDVLVFVTLEESISSFLSFLKSVKRPIHFLSCSISSLVNLLEAWNTPLSKSQNSELVETYIYLGIENSYLLFFKNGFLNHSSSLDWGCREIIDEMKKIYKLDKSKAWKEFFHKSFLLTQNQGFSKEQVFFSNLVKKHVEKLISQFNLLNMSLASKENVKISKVRTFGPGSIIRNLNVFLEKKLNIPFHSLKKFLPFPHWNWKEQAYGLIATGLALEGLKRYPYQGLDFLHSKKQLPSLFSLGKLKKKAIIACMAFFILLSYVVVKDYETSKLLLQIEEVFNEYGRKIAYLSPNKLNVENVESFLKKERKILEAKEIIKKELSKANSLDYLEKVVHKIGSSEKWNLNLESLRIFGSKIEIKGSIDSSKQEDFYKFLKTLALAQSISSGEAKKKAVSINSKGDQNKMLSSDESEKKDQHIKAVFSYSFQFK
ncbi:MAG: hypothetical protein GDA46_05670 [Bdellovibrionales bacterium]|nr:hypothetical protein [Bdellovibrionales bacterium]